jgi:septal ring factor EnvC (AmiA/AmiB activator)
MTVLGFESSGCGHRRREKGRAASFLQGCQQMAGMRRADRHTSSDDLSINHPRMRRPEPTSGKELNQLLSNVRSQRDEAKEQVVVKEQQLEESQRLYQEQREKLESTLVLYQETQEQASSHLLLYTEEKARNSELEIQYNKVQQESQNYLALYKQIEQELKLERRSKAGIKGWETRRKRENERLKQEIGEMAIVLRESLTKKDQAIQSLEEVATRMDRIQKLVDSVDDEVANNPIGMLQKLQRIWIAIREILAE